MKFFVFLSFFLVSQVTLAKPFIKFKDTSNRIKEFFINKDKQLKKGVVGLALASTVFTGSLAYQPPAHGFVVEAFFSWILLDSIGYQGSKMSPPQPTYVQPTYVQPTYVLDPEPWIPPASLESWWENHKLDEYSQLFFDSVDLYKTYIEAEIAPNHPDYQCPTCVDSLFSDALQSYRNFMRALFEIDDWSPIGRHKIGLDRVKDRWDTLLSLRRDYRNQIRSSVQLSNE